MFDGGYVGVDIFFVISGYLITSLLLKDLDSDKFSIIQFYERRARRILPALVVVVCVCAGLAWLWMLPQQLEAFAKSQIAVTLFYSNVFFYMESGYFSRASELKPLLHTWSLAVEEQFYIVFPPALFLIYKLQRRWQIVFVIIGAVVTLIAAQLYFPQNPNLVFYAAPTRAWELLAGVICAYILRYHPTLGANQILSTLGLVVILLSVVFFRPGPPIKMAIVVGAVMLIILFARRDTFASRFLGHPWLVGIGLISYSAYLWHQPLFAFARIQFSDALNPYTFIALSVCALGLGYVSWRFVETPFRVRSNGEFRIPVKTVWLGTALSGVVLVAAGLSVVYGNIAPRNLDKLTPEISEIARLKYDVKPWVGDGICSLYFPESALGDWACDPFKHGPLVPELTPLGIAVVGDSYSGDLAASLRAVGFSPFQGSMPGCDVEPGSMKRPCRRFFDHIKQQIMLQPRVREIWIDASYSATELTDKALARMVKYWTIEGRKIFVKTASPMYPDLENIRLRGILQGRPPAVRISWGEANSSAAPRVTDTLEAAGVILIDGAKIYCGMTNDCAPFLPDGQYLMRDKNHLSMLGLKRYGKGLLRHAGCGLSPELTRMAVRQLDCGS